MNVFRYIVKEEVDLSGLFLLVYMRDYLAVTVTAPDMSMDDAKWFLFASKTQNIISSQGDLMDYMYFRFDAKNQANEYDIPICLIQGDSDWITPTDMAADYYRSVSSAKKEMIIIENAGHTPFLDAPEQFCSAVKSFLEKYSIR